eukprot:m51a1_g6036 hypothetical protein (276) ;mRNA; r:153048-154188
MEDLSEAFCAVDAGDLQRAWCVLQRLRVLGAHRVCAALLSRALLLWSPRVCLADGPVADAEAYACACADEDPIDLLYDARDPGDQQLEARADLVAALDAPDAPLAHVFVAASWAELVVGDSVAGMRGYARCGNFPPALYALGVMSEARHPLEPSECVGYYSRAASVGHCGAAFNLGAIIERKLDADSREGTRRRSGLRADAEEALRLYNLAAGGGYALAWLNVGKMLCKQKGKQAALPSSGLMLDARAAVGAFREGENVGDCESTRQLDERFRTR